MLLLPQTLLLSTVLAPLTLHRDNPRLFSLGDKPLALVGSGEHYGAVLNLDFDYGRYLLELQRHGLNLTRTFSGTYREIPGSFGIEGNTLAPAPERYACPWARSDEPGYRGGGQKFDLRRFDETYFERLRDFVATAGRCGVMVEYVLFCPFYNQDLWLHNPMQVDNNINGIGRCALEEVYTGQHADLQTVQQAFVQRVVTELNGFDNLYFEICNEPYFGGVTLDWQARIATVIAETEAGLPNRHLIAQNIANETATVQEPIDHVDIYNFHYASPPVAVAANWHLNRPIAFDETGFAGSNNRVYRSQAWHFLLAGGAAFSNLDYSFRAGAEDGNAPINAPGGGGADLRASLAILARALDRLDLVRAEPLTGKVHAPEENKLTVSAFGVPGERALLYCSAEQPTGQPTWLALDSPPGRYTLESIDTLSGARASLGAQSTVEGRLRVVVPPLGEDMAIEVRRE